MKLIGDDFPTLLEEWSQNNDFLENADESDESGEAWLLNQRKIISRSPYTIDTKTTRNLGSSFNYDQYHFDHYRYEILIWFFF